MVNIIKSLQRQRISHYTESTVSPTDYIRDKERRKSFSAHTHTNTHTHTHTHTHAHTHTESHHAIGISASCADSAALAPSHQGFSVGLRGISRLIYLITRYIITHRLRTHTLAHAGRPHPASAPIAVSKISVIICTSECLQGGVCQCGFVFGSGQCILCMPDRITANKRD